MDNFKFTKSYIKENNNNNFFSQVNEIKRIERIHDNMSGINPFTKEKYENKHENNLTNDIQNNQLRNQLNAMNNIKKD